MKRSLRRRTGFTLIEVLLVIGILLVLGTVSVVSYTRIKAGADKNNTTLMVKSTVDAVGYFHAALNRYPTEEEGLEGLLTAPEDEKEAQKWKDGGGPWLKDGSIPSDPWGNELKYEAVEEGAATGEPFRIWSLGPDGEDGTDDDIRSWKEDAGA